MNIFILSEDPIEAAQMQCNKHVVKMIVESAQMLCTAVGGKYKPTHANHPCSKWIRENRSNFGWAVKHAKALAAEYTFRYGKIHKSEEVIDDCATRINALPDGALTKFALAMPDEFRSDDVVESYRKYYHTKSHFAKWTNRELPYWWNVE